MSNEKQLVNKSINYIEFGAVDFSQSKTFFEKVFDWKFEEYGTEYLAFEGEGLMGGFYASKGTSTQENGGALLVFYSDDLECMQSEIKSAGGVISRPVFEFPGGRRFHFIEPSGNEMAVWSDK